VSRRDNADARCARCRLHQGLCLCASIPTVETRARLVLVIHRYEERKPTNTGRLAAACLPNSEIVVRGHEHAPSAPIDVGEGYEPVLLFPHPEAPPLAPPEPGARPVALIVPDGTWRQASKVRSRVPGLRDVRCVTLPADAPSIYRLRSEAHAGGLATAEAIARAMGILEGLHVRRAIEEVFRTMVERTLWVRGEIATEDVTGGIPAGMMRHVPRPR
jgi:DTW domain-containing protein YfiP